MLHATFTLSTLFHLILIVTLTGQLYSYPHFKLEKD